MRKWNIVLIFYPRRSRLNTVLFLFIPLTGWPHLPLAPQPLPHWRPPRPRLDARPLLLNMHRLVPVRHREYQSLVMVTVLFFLLLLEKHENFHSWVSKESLVKHPVNFQVLAWQDKRKERLTSNKTELGDEDKVFKQNSVYCPAHGQFWTLFSFLSCSLAWRTCFCSPPSSGSSPWSAWLTTRQCFHSSR